MNSVYRQTCRVCGSPHLVAVIDLGDQHLQGGFAKEGVLTPPKRRVATKLVRCDVTKNENGCGLLQMAVSVPPEILYSNYWYRSGTNATMRNHLRGIAESITAMLQRPPKAVLDIGCNDGTLLSCYPEETAKFGVDPSDIAREIPAPITVINDVFPSSRLLTKMGGTKFDAVTSIAMFYDLETPIDFARSIKSVLADDGLWVLEMSYLPLMLKQNSFDTICHEHLEYYSLAVLGHIAQKAGMRIVRALLNEINGGSIRLYLTHAESVGFEDPEWRRFLQALAVREFEMALDLDEPYLAFQKRAEEVRDKISGFIRNARANGKKIHVYGASTKGNTLLQWCGLDASLIDCAADRNPAKDGARTLGTEIPIVSEEKSRALKPDYYLVLPWHFKAEFLERERGTIAAGTRMIFPLPEPVVVSADNIDEEIAKAKSLDLYTF